MLDLLDWKRRIFELYSEVRSAPRPHHGRQHWRGVRDALFRRLVIDFNFAYNPSCSYGDRWACPLTPPPNRLDIEIRAGERTACGRAVGSELAGSVR